MASSIIIHYDKYIIIKLYKIMDKKNINVIRVYTIVIDYVVKI